MDKEIGVRTWSVYSGKQFCSIQKPRNTMTDLGLELTWCGIPGNLLDNVITKKSKLKGQNLTTLSSINLYLTT